MLKRWYLVEVMVTPKEGERYSIFRRKRLTKKEAKVLEHTHRCGLYNLEKPYIYIDYKVTKI